MKVSLSIWCVRIELQAGYLLLQGRSKLGDNSKTGKTTVLTHNRKVLMVYVVCCGSRWGV